jgi:hypothetical protein
MGLLSIFKNIGKRGLKDVTNPEKWSIYMDGGRIKRHGINLEYDEIVSYSEQLVYRMRSCPDCVKKGECIKCSCPIPLSMMTSQNKCSEGNWGQMLSPEQWNDYKQKMGIDLRIALK